MLVVRRGEQSSQFRDSVLPLLGERITEQLHYRLQHQGQRGPGGTLRADRRR
ncbi:MAG: hypothetical protein ACTHWV_14845 [Brachybacterium sp.]